MPAPGGQLAVGDPGARGLSVRLADFAAAPLARDCRRRGVRADPRRAVSAGTYSWSATPQLTDTPRDTNADVRPAGTFVSHEDRRY